MFIRIIENMEFSIPLYLEELDIDQLVFFHFSLSNDLSDFGNISDSNINSFRKVLAKKGFAAPDNLTKKGLIKDILAIFELEKIKSNLLALIYINDFNNLPKNSESILVCNIAATSRVLFGANVTKLIDTLSMNNTEEALYKFVDNYCINKKVCMNIIGLLLLVCAFENYKKSIKKDSDLTFYNEFLIVIYEKFIYYYNMMVSKQFSVLLNTEKSNIKKNNDLLKQLETQKNNVLKLKETIKRLNDEIKALKKEIKENSSTVNNDIVNRLLDSNNSKDLQIEKLTSDIKNIKEKPTQMYKQMVQDLSNQLIDKKSQLNDKNNEIKDLKNKLNNIKPKDIYTTIKDYINENEFDEKLFDLINPYYKQYTNKHNIEIIKDKKEEIVLEDDKIYDKVGYCVIENNNFYVVFPKGVKEIIKDIPENLYIGEYQFVIVDHENRFKWVFHHRYEKMATDIAIYKFGCVKKTAKGLCLNVGNFHPLKEIKHIPNNRNIKEDDVVSVDSNYKFLCYYKKAPYNVDTYIKSVMAKSHKMFYVLKVLSNGLLLRNVVTQEENFKPMDITDLKIEEKSVIALNEKDELMMIYKKNNFYTSSNFYQKGEHGSVEIISDNIFIKKLSGEIALVNKIPSNITLTQGQVIIVDEFNTFLNVDDEEITEKSVNKKINKSCSRKNDGFNSSEIEVSKTVTIVGNISHENSYKLALLKEGYKANIVDGHDSWNKISSYLKDVDAIVLVTEYISHDNMWRIKDNIKDIPIIYAKYSGANRIIEQIQSLENISDEAI